MMRVLRAFGQDVRIAWYWTLGLVLPFWDDMKFACRWTFIFLFMLAFWLSAMFGMAAVIVKLTH